MTLRPRWMPSLRQSRFWRHPRSPRCQPIVFQQRLHGSIRFLPRLGSFSSTKKIREDCQLVMDAIKTMCSGPGHFGNDVRNSHGVSIFSLERMGEEDVIVRYKELEFLKATGWNDFLKRYRVLADDFEKKTVLSSSAFYPNRECFNRGFSRVDTD